MAERPIIIESLCLFTTGHLWLYPTQHDCLVGLSEFAQDQRSDVTYLELPAIDQVFDMGEPNVLLESVKAAENLLMPVTGRISRVNAKVCESPQLVNESPYGDGWLYALQPLNQSELNRLMCFADYDAWLDQ